MLLSQVRQVDGQRVVVAREGQMAWIVPGATSVYALAQAALSAGQRLEEEIAVRGKGESVDLDQALAEGRVLLPINHPDPAHLHLTGTGLTHLGSASTRNAMHANSDPETLTDSMKMFRMGIEDGKPTPGGIGVQPEWFYKGNGHAAVAPESPLRSPGFALDAGEDNMSHSLGNLEHHHFKYDVFRQPGDVHVHFLGTATLSFTDEIRVDHGDVFEIASPAFGLPLRNPLEQCQATHSPVQIARL
jgi:hypothetical protein